ncbi:ABC transporter permease [Halosimplex rubrum]|uniref:ABC transporter permease n=1 Tax=Halosimplex rubrum TaxID=869889 RepID=A0A7D5T3G2_9EURY|nr:ABC transporter permease [Halosimplex rubrum]QLH76890.1 ABC transporter permease [Halosimplex rubrum]
MSPFARLRAVVGVAVAQLRHERVRTVIAVAGVAMAVLAAVLLASVGVGVLEFGQQKFEQSGQDLWVTGGPIELRPGTVGGFQNSLVDSHKVATEIEEREAVATAVPMIFQTVYAGRNSSEFQTLVGVGAPTNGNLVTMSEGREFSPEDAHYANGTYEGPMSHEVVIDPRTADLLDISVNDTMYLGGTIGTARQNEFTVVGISPTYSQFVGAPSVVIPPSELQEITGTTASDRASFVLVRAEDGADVAALEANLTESYSQYTIRTNEEQLRATLENQAVVLLSGGSLFVLAVVAGVLLVLNLQLSFVFRHREMFAAVTAIGLSRSALAGLILVYTLLIGIIGGLLGIGLAIPGVEAVNAVTAVVTGFEGVARLSHRILLGGFGLAIFVSLVGGLAASLYLARSNPLDSLY